MDFSKIAPTAPAPQANGQELRQGKYIKWNSPGVEIIEPGEDEVKAKTAGHFCAMQRQQFQSTQHARRATHLKTQGCVVGKLTVNDNLPEHLAQSMFSKAGTYDIVARYSSLPFVIAPDTLPAPRGFGMKVFGVEGEKLFGTDSTQDFTFNNYPTLELRTLTGACTLGDSLERNFFHLDRFLEEQAAREDKEVASAPARIPPQAHMTAMTQWSQGAYRYGDYVAKFALFPATEDQEALKPVLLKESDPMDILASNLRRYHKEKAAKWSFRVQLLENLDEQPVEDTGIEWNEEKYPFQEVGMLEFPPQESFDNSFRTWFDDSGVACNPWHGLTTLQPLGSAQRSRRMVYAESRKLRLKVNGCPAYKEPKDVKEVPIAVTAGEIMVA